MRFAGTILAALFLLSVGCGHSHHHGLPSVLPCPEDEGHHSNHDKDDCGQLPTPTPVPPKPTPTPKVHL